MPRAEKIYRRLPGRAAGLASYHRLWLGPDHVLSVRATGYTEEYKRFYFRDIQAFLTRKTDSWLIGSVILGVLAGVPVLVAVGLSDLSSRAFLFWISGMFFFFLLINLAKGPTCVCHIRTAVQTEPLPTLGRFRRARKVFAMLRPGIEAAQGAFAPERWPSVPSAAAKDRQPETVARSAAETVEPPQPPSPDI